MKSNPSGINCFPQEVGFWCHDLARELWPINRSLTGPGVRQTLARLQQEVPELVVHEVPSGSSAFDWTVPDEWILRDAFVEDESGARIIDIADSNLHVVGYSEPVDMWVDRDELDGHLYSLPEQPDAIPYVTSYYKRRWGFCLTQKKRDALGEGRYRVVVDADLGPGVLNYGEIILPGNSEDEVFISTYVCHPSMANNELSGPVVTIAIAKWLAQLQDRKFTYRIVFIPETIGSLVYMSRNLEVMKNQVRVGFNVSCVGDDRCYSYLPSRHGDTYSDRVARHVLSHIDRHYQSYTWLDRGSDERQYCAPGIDLPIASMMRSKYGEYPEYHTSLDDLDTVVTPEGLGGGFNALKKAIEIIETNFTPQVTTLGEPQLGKRGLYPDISVKGSADNVGDMMAMISYCDGALSLLEISDKIGVPYWSLYEIIGPLIEGNLIRRL